jgi:hypothetical protein
MDQKRWIKRWRWASDRAGARYVLIAIAVLLRILFPGIWTTWPATIFLALVFIFFLWSMISLAIRAYHRKD